MNNVETLEEKAEQLLTQINRHIGDAACSEQSQCKALAIGHRSCGGPSAYLAYSTLSIDENELLRLSKEHTATHREINRIKGLMSTCEMLMPPPIACENGKCKIQ